MRQGKRGLTSQRNEILRELDAFDVIVFFDDDFFPKIDYLAEIERFFLGNAVVVAVTGRPIVDGANGPGVDSEAALALLEADEKMATDRDFAPTYGTYGCNMAFRVEAIRRSGAQFDEKLPLYGWQEDIDFSRQLSGHGRIVDSKALRGVHLGTKSGRTSGVKVGYSQIANPVYLIRKGTVSFGFAGALVGRNVLANLSKSFCPEPWIDRRGRLLGNCLALRDLVTGRISPQRILELN